MNLNFTHKLCKKVSCLQTTGLTPGSLHSWLQNGHVSLDKTLNSKRLVFKMWLPVYQNSPRGLIKYQLLLIYIFYYLGLSGIQHIVTHYNLQD